MHLVEFFYMGVKSIYLACVYVCGRTRVTTPVCMEVRGQLNSNCFSPCTTWVLWRMGGGAKPGVRVGSQAL